MRPLSVLTVRVRQLRLFSLPASSRPPRSNSSQAVLSSHYTKPSLRSCEVPPPFPTPPPPPVSRAASKSRVGSGSDVAGSTPGAVRDPAWAPKPFPGQDPAALLSAEAQGGLTLRGPHPLRRPVLRRQGEPPWLCAGPNASPALTMDGTSSPRSGLRTGRREALRQWRLGDLCC